MIVFIQGTFPHYRREVFNEVCKHDKVLLVHSGPPNKKESDKFSECILPMVKIGPFRIQKGLHGVIKRAKPSIVISMFDIRWLSSIYLMYISCEKTRWIWWGLDKGASKIALKLKLLVAKRNTPIVFYNSHIRQEMVSLGLDAKRCFVANNTVHVEGMFPCFDNPVKDTFINVGTLDSRKQNDVSILVFKRIILRTNLNLRLVFIGDGIERERLEELVVNEGLSDNVIFTGHIEGAKELIRYYRRAIASISFGQAGLAVLQSMAFGVPFVTKKNAISGGEKYNIIHGENGLFCKDSLESLEDVMYDLVRDNNCSYARKLGKNAFNYYKTQASVENMVNGFLDAQKYLENSNG